MASNLSLKIRDQNQADSSGSSTLSLMSQHCPKQVLLISAAEHEELPTPERIETHNIYT